MPPIKNVGDVTDDIVAEIEADNKKNKFSDQVSEFIGIGCGILIFAFFGTISIFLIGCSGYKNYSSHGNSCFSIFAKWSVEDLFKFLGAIFLIFLVYLIIEFFRNKIPTS